MTDPNVRPPTPEEATAPATHACSPSCAATHRRSPLANLLLRMSHDGRVQAARKRADGASADMRPRPEALDMVRAAIAGHTAACPEHGIQIVDDGRPRCGCPMEEMAHG